MWRKGFRRHHPRHSSGSRMDWGALNAGRSCTRSGSGSWSQMQTLRPKSCIITGTKTFRYKVAQGPLLCDWAGMLQRIHCGSTAANKPERRGHSAIVKCELAGQMTRQDLHLAFFACVGARYWVALLTCGATLVGFAVILQAHQAAQGHVICGVGSPRLAGLWRRPDSLLLEPASSVA